MGKVSAINMAWTYPIINMGLALLQSGSRSWASLRESVLFSKKNVIIIVPVGKPHSNPIVREIANARYFEMCIDLIILMMIPVSIIKGRRMGIMELYHRYIPSVHPSFIRAEFMHENIIAEIKTNIHK